MTPLIIQFLISAAVIVVAGTFLARAADTIAELTGLGRLLVGSILLAGATSLPEITVDISAVRSGMPDLAVGDLLGSSLANLLILAVADLLHRDPKKIFSRASAAHALSGVISINMTAIAGMMIFLGPAASGLEIGPLGIGPLLIGVAYLFGVRLLYFDQKEFTAKKDHEHHPTAGSRRKALFRALTIFILAAVAILFSGPFLAESAGKIAELTGLGKTFIGSTLVALSTSLPELVSTLAAVRMGAFDLAVGNIFGSNTFNMLILVPLDFIHEGPLLASVSRTHLLTAFSAIMATSVAIMGQLYQVEKRKKFIEPDAFVIIGIVVGTLSLLYYVGTG